MSVPASGTTQLCTLRSAQADKPLDGWTSALSLPPQRRCGLTFRSKRRRGRAPATGSWTTHGPALPSDSSTTDHRTRNSLASRLAVSVTGRGPLDLGLSSRAHCANRALASDATKEAQGRVVPVVCVCACVGTGRGKRGAAAPRAFTLLSCVRYTVYLIKLHHLLLCLPRGINKLG